MSSRVYISFFRPRLIFEEAGLNLFWLDFVQSPVKIAITLHKLEGVVQHFFPAPVRNMPYVISACVASGQCPDDMKGHIEAGLCCRLALKWYLQYFFIACFTFRAGAQSTGVCVGAHRGLCERHRCRPQRRGPQLLGGLLQVRHSEGEDGGLFARAYVASTSRTRRPRGDRGNGQALSAGANLQHHGDKDDVGENCSGSAWGEGFVRSMVGECQSQPVRSKGE